MRSLTPEAFVVEVAAKLRELERSDEGQAVVAAAGYLVRRLFAANRELPAANRELPAANT